MSRSSTGTTRDTRVSPLSCHNGVGLGTDILTADGEIPVEFLEPGDRIVTFDQGLVQLARIEPSLVPPGEAVLVRPSVLEPTRVSRDVVLSARQQILLRDWRARILWKRPIALVEAQKLIDGVHIARLLGNAPVRLFKLVFDDRQHLVETASGNILLASARLPARVRS